MYMSELSWLYSAQLVRFMAVGLCLGTSTVVMTMYFYLVSKGKTEPAEQKMMGILYRILRVGMVLALATEASSFLYYFHVDNFIYWTDNPELLIRFTIFAVIVANASAMQHRKITMWLGPVLAGGSWYAYFFFSVWIETQTTYFILLSGYLIWLCVVFALVTSLRLYLTRNQKTYLGDGAVVKAAAR